MVTPLTLSELLKRVARHTKKPLTATLLTLTAYALEITAQKPPTSLVGYQDREFRDSAVVIAQISDPHLFEEPKRKTWIADEVEDQQAFAQALEFLGSTAVASGTLPDALVITGDLGIDSSFVSKRDTTASPTSRDAQVASVANLLRVSPIKRVFVVAGNNDVANELPDPAELRYFHSFIANVANSVRRNGVVLRDLTACYADPAVTGSECYEDLRDGVRLVGFASATFKNAPPLAKDEDKLLQYALSRRAPVAARTLALDEQFVQRLASLVSAAARVRKKAVILTHEPDLDDPFAIDTIRARRGSYPDPATTYDPAVWNVDSRVREGWVRVANDPTVVAVLAGHFHSANRGDYFRPYPSSSAAGRANPERLFVSPPLAIKNQNGKSPQARGISLYRIAGQDVQREVAWYQFGTGFSAAQTDRPGNALAPTSEVGAPDLSASDRMGIVIFAILAASGAVLVGLKAGLWRVREHSALPPLGWKEHFGYTWVVVWGLSGLLLALLLYSYAWANRSEVALWYGGAFGVWTAASALALYFTR